MSAHLQLSIHSLSYQERTLMTPALEGIMKFIPDPIVSCDIIGDNYSSIVDGLSTMAINSLVKVLSWYDNEWMHSCRCADMFRRLGQWCKYELNQSS